MHEPFPDLTALRSGGKRVLSRVLTRIETSANDPETAAYLDRIAGEPGGHVLGLTGPPGVGKSTLTDALIRAFRDKGDSVAVLAVDPSSAISGGALLGDRTRLTTDPDDSRIFVRSMAARDRLGGLSDHSVAAIAVLRAAFDHVIVETVGIGQSEGDLKQAADTVLLCIQPGSGDSLQFMKAGIMELPDVVAVTKSDMGAVARRAVADVKGALTLSPSTQGGWTVPVGLVSSQSGEGLADLMAHVRAHQDFLQEEDRLVQRRAAQHCEWFRDRVQSEYGQSGLRLCRKLGDGPQAPARTAPFSSFVGFATHMERCLSGG
jgi:LAO/AO transport system kinase